MMYSRLPMHNKNASNSLARELYSSALDVQFVVRKASGLVCGSASSKHGKHPIDVRQKFPPFSMYCNNHGTQCRTQYLTPRALQRVVFSTPEPYIKRSWY